MAKKPLNVEQGVQLDKQGSARTYNERDEGLLYNNQNLGIRVQTEGADRELLTDTQIQSVQNKSLDNTNSLVIKDTNLTIEDESSPTKNIKFDVASVSTSQVFRFPDTTDEIVTKNFAQTISGKSIDADTNTISNLEVDNFKSGVVITSVSSVSTNNEIPTSQAVFGFVSSGVATDLSNHLSDTTDAHDASAISNIPSGNLAATDQQGVNNELQSDIDTRALDSAVVHKTGNESIAGIKTFSDTTQSTTKDDGGAIFEGGVGIEKNLNVGGDVVITGGLQVNGTTTFVNTTNMQVADATIEVNKGGNQAAANSADAGIEVVMTDATTAKIGYDSTLASKFAIGEVGSLKEIVDVSSSQTLSGKTIDGDVNTLQDVGISSLKTVLADASKFIARDGSGAVVSTNTVPSGTVVGTSDTQVLTNKDIDGGTASNSKRITIPKDTVANLNSLTRKEATVVYATDTDKLYVDDGSTLNPVGSGGVGNPAVYSLLKSDEDTGTWSTGNNATFLGGGSIAGTFTKQNATNPLNGTYSYTLVQAAGSLNDYIASDVQAVPLRSRGVTNSTDLVYTYDGSDNDIKWVVYDVTNATVVTPVTAYVKASSVGKTAQLVYDLPVTCTQVRFGAQVVVANNGKTLKFDDVQLSAWTPQAVNLMVQEYLAYSGYSSKNANNQAKFTTKSTKSDNSIVISDSNSGDFTKVTALKKCLVNVKFQWNGLATSTTSYIYHYDSAGNVIDMASSGRTSNINSTIPYTAEMNAGDYLAFVNTDGLQAPTNFSITASAISENVVQSWQDGMATWSTTSTIQIGATTTAPTKGTTDLDQVKWIKRGESAEFWYQYSQTGAGNAGSGDYLFTLPNGMQFADHVIKYTTLEGVAGWTTGKVGICAGTGWNSGAANYVMFIFPYDNTRFRVAYIGASDASQTGSGVVGSGAAFNMAGSPISFSLKFSAPILGWSSTPTLLALPTSKENVFSARISNSGSASILSQSSDWIDSVTYNTTGQTTINFSKLGLTSTPAITVVPIGIDNNDTSVVLYSPTATSVQIATMRNGVYYNTGYQIHLQKQSPDYTAPGVFVGNVAKNQVAYVKDVKASGTNGGSTTAGSWLQRDINTIEGDSSIVSVSSNTFTLQAGDYDIEVESPAYATGYHKIGLALSGSSTPDIALGTSEWSGSAGSYATTKSRIISRITISAATTYKILHRTGVSVANNGFGAAVGFGVNEVYTQVKITKLNGQ